MLRHDEQQREPTPAATEGNENYAVKVVPPGPQSHSDPRSVEKPLLPALDSLRQFARYGTGQHPRGFLALVHGDGRFLHFPRTNQLHAFRQTPGEPGSDEQQLQLAVDEDGRPLPPPPDALPLRDIQHRLQVWRDADGVHFSWLLFSCFWFQLWLPPELPIYRSSTDVWDFSTGTQRSARG